MKKQEIVKGLAIRNYSIFFPLKTKEIIKLDDCHFNLLKNQIPCRETYNQSIFITFEELSFNFFSSGKGTLYFSKETLSVGEANEILNRFYYAFIEAFVIGDKS